MFGKKVVVLGGTGVVGRAVINELSKQGYETRVAVRRPERFRDFALFPGTKLATLSSYDDVDQLKALFADTDIVI
ncbi:MAG: NAD(P)H-binding protein, partial [Hydrogenovibrio sp.]|nr:NAD(P)H-binding protein [Hydrogenovibrio sp.]